ncbi:MAG TPA: winged helix DNA-binding domain-containing protein, partial [Jiangellaceae bacterium]
CTDAIAANERRQTLKMIAEGDITDDAEAWLADAGAGVLKALADRGEATTQQIAEDVPALRQQIVLAPGKPYESKSTMGPRVMFQIAAEGRVIRTRPVKSWSSANRWALTEAWLPDLALDRPVPDAEQELARAWLRAFGPGTVADFKWWTGWTISRARKVLAAVGAVEVGLEDGETGYVLPDDLDPVGEPEPWTAFLPSLDPAVMGWAMPGRDWYLHDPAKQQLYDRSGNIGPTVWSDGRVVGGWAQRADGTIAYRLFEDIGTDGTQMVSDTAGTLETWLGDVRVKPRFPTPIDKELSA